MKTPTYKNVIGQTLAVLAMGVSASPAHAISVDWSGNYRLEYTEVDRTSLDDPKERKSYILNHLSLSPKIVATDGVNIVAKLDVLSNDNYPDSYVGQTFGRPPTKKSASVAGSKDESSVAGDKQGASDLRVSQLYMNFNQEYGQLVVGRAPLDFGLGISYSAGNGPFDHWYTTRDMIGYKFVIGNFYLMPILAKVSDATVAQGQEVQDMIWNAEYNNPETESAISLMHRTRTGSDTSNDAAPATPGGEGLFGSNTTAVGGWKTQHINLAFSRGFEAMKFKIEAGFESGGTGVFRGGEEISLNTYGIALEADFPAGDSKWQYALRAGIASGDNPTTNNYEGFHFHRNYNVAFLMFNHPLGRYDLLRTAEQRTATGTACSTAPRCYFSNSEALDEEALSNSFYLSPRAVYTLNDKWDWTNTLTYAQLQSNPVANIDVAKDLGFEWDTGLVYKPSERVMWVNELGLLFPGSAWVGGSQNFGKGFTYGFASKAVISF